MVAVGDLLKVSRDDIQDFPGDTIKLVLEMQKDGWRAQRSNRNHIMLFGPDGETRLSASRNADSARYLAEDLRKYNKAQGKETVEPVKVRRVTAKFPCIKEDCNRTFNSAENLTLHVGLDHDGLIKCPDCNELVKDAKTLGRHRGVKHGYVSPRYAARKAAEAKRQAVVDAAMVEEEASAETFEDDRIEEAPAEIKQGQVLKNDQRWDEVVGTIDQVNEPFGGVELTGKLNYGVASTFTASTRDILGLSIYAEPRPEDVEHIDFLDERDSWTLNLDDLMDMDLRTITKVLTAAGLKLELRSWKE